MFVHICCSVDSHYFLKKLKEDFPHETIVGFFYNPNIHPYSEYMLRLLDVQKSCKKLNIPLIEGDYNFNQWFKLVENLENEPEKGARCNLCFYDRLLKTVQKAIKLNLTKFTTTLLMSPLKSQNKLLEIGQKLEKNFQIQFIFRDYRKNGGVEEQNRVAKNEKLYRQNYCGCFFALNQQRKQQNRLASELFCDISNKILPASIEEKIEIYQKLEHRDSIQKDTFLNYRLLQAKISIDKNIIPSYFIFYSFSEKEIIKGKIIEIHNGIGFFNRNNIKFISLNSLNKFLSKDYNSILELLKQPLLISDELKLRNMIFQEFSLSPLIIIDNELIKVLNIKIEILIKSKIFIDTRETLIKD